MFNFSVNTFIGRNPDTQHYIPPVSFGFSGGHHDDKASGMRLLNEYAF
jgi:hypothetical protein